jgi:hypothetical protein
MTLELTVIIWRSSGITRRIAFNGGKMQGSIWFDSENDLEAYWDRVYSVEYEHMNLDELWGELTSVARQIDVP